MTDRVNSFLVVLDRDMRDDDAEAVLTALRMVKHVIAVTPNVATFSDVVAASRARREIEARLLAALQDPAVAR